MFVQYDTQRKDDPRQAASRIRFIKEIREIFTSSTEKLSDQAFEQGHL